MTSTKNVMQQVNEDLYHSLNGYQAQIEYGFTPNGDSIGGRWVLRDEDSNWIDVDQYRHDLFERNGFKTSY